MDYKNNSKVQDIINIFKKNFEIVNIFIVRGVYDLLADKDKKDEYNLKNTVENIFETDDDKTKCEPSTKETSQKNSSSNPNYNNNDDPFGSSNQNEKPNSFNTESQEYKKKYPEVANEIFETFSLLDEKIIEGILTEVKNHFVNN